MSEGAPIGTSLFGITIVPSRRIATKALSICSHKHNHACARTHAQNRYCAQAAPRSDCLVPLAMNPMGKHGNCSRRSLYVPKEHKSSAGGSASTSKPPTCLFSSHTATLLTGNGPWSSFALTQASLNQVRSTHHLEFKQSNCE